MAEFEFPNHETAIEIYYPDIQSVSEEEYAIIRRGGLGASDCSVFLGLMAQFNKDSEGLIVEKCRTTISDEEKEIGMKPAVRKGKELEPMILDKVEQALNTRPIKPVNMYKIKEYPYLTINFDGVFDAGEAYIPVECKFVTTFGEKHYKASNAVFTEYTGWNPVKTITLKPYGNTILIDHINEMAERCGIPPYYYAQVQQQILALNSPYGYLCALHDKDWKLRLYYVPRDEAVINKIILLGYKISEKIKACKRE